MKVTRQLRISGRVQGVGYRYATCLAARRHTVHGWVRNRRDGTVEAMLHGDEACVMAMIEWCRQGPPAAQVLAVIVEEVSGEFDGFSERETL
ncbi:acylphosphatase [Chitinivorax sp. PXF-14]|uniref:acylphosphatase n=1 Tax=Chitinivorax sp. PXF-14 TaxID=3230488 RepID=UPI00346767E0